MADIHNDPPRKPYTDIDGLPIASHPSSPITSSEPDPRGPRCPPGQPHKIFGYELYISSDILNRLQCQSWLQGIRRAGEVQSIKFNLQLSIPDLNGRNIQIYDRDMQKKYASCQALLADVYHTGKKLHGNFSIIIFVPEGMVSLLIGTKGFQINKIMRMSHTTIVVNQPINRMTYRTVKITGYHSDIAKACRIIYEILEDKSSIAYSIEKEPSQLDYNKSRVKTKFILCGNLLSKLLTRKRQLLYRLEEETKCIVKFREETSGRVLRRDEQLCVVLGRLEDVQAYLVTFINVLHVHLQQAEAAFKLLIPSNYITKLIGQKGYMIRDIIDRSGGAQIKIMSDRPADRDSKQCVIAINGTRQNKIDAACLILEQIECFKNGGPILSTGKCINDNLALQFRNSLPICKQLEGEVTELGTGALYKQEQMQNLRLTNYKLEGSENLRQEGLISGEEQEQLQMGTSTQQPSEQPEHEQSTQKQTPKQQPENKQTQQQNKQHQPQNKQTQPQSKQQTQPESKQGVPPRAQKRKGNRSSSRRSDSSSGSRSRKKSHKQSKARSSSSDYQQDREYSQLKVVVPRRLAQDHRELKYIQSLSRSQISVREQRVEGSNEAIVSVKGTVRQNSQCIKLLQKRILRMGGSAR